MRIIRAIGRWVWDAAKVEPRVAAGLAVAALITLLVGGYFTLLALFTLISGEFGGAVLFAALAVVLSMGFALPVFLIFAMSRLFLLVWTVTPYGVDESWAHPKARLDLPPQFLYHFNGSPRIVRVRAADYGLDDDAAISVLDEPCYPVMPRAERSEYSWVDVHNALDKRRAQKHFEPKGQELWEKVNWLAIFGIIAVSLFWGVALISEVQRGA